MNKNSNCLIIGFGRMGERWFHVLKKLKFKNIFVVEKSKKKIKIIIKSNKIFKNKIYNNIEEFLKIKKPIIGIVATTADTHKDYVIKLAKNKTKNIIVEKPMATSVKNCNEMINVCKKFKSKLAVNHQTRFTDEIQLIKKIILKYKLGKLVSMNVVGGNAGFAMGGVHFIEIFNFLTKNKIFKVSSYLERKKTRNPRGKQFRDSSGQIIAKNKKNQTLYINLSCYQGHGTNITYSFKNGNILVNKNGLLNVNIREKKYFNYPLNLHGLPEINKNYKFKKNNLVETTATLLSNFLKNKNYPTGNGGVETIKTLVAIMESNKVSGQFKELSKTNILKNYPWA